MGVDGSTIPSNARRYAEERLVCPAPTPVPLRTSNTKLSRVWGGRWQNLTDCLVETWTSNSSTDSIGVAVDGVYPPDPSRTKSLGSTGAPNLFADDVPDPDPGWKHAPRSLVIADGCILAACEVRAASNGITHAVSLAYWDENVAATSEDLPGALHGERKWKLHRVGPMVQSGRRRGDGWMASGPWIPPGGMDAATGKLVDFFMVFTDYRNNPGSYGGQLFVTRCRRASPEDRWTLEPTVLLYGDEPEGQLLAIPGELNYMHFHSAAVTFPGGGTEGRRMVVTLSVGDGWPNNRMVNISRDDFETYDEQTDSADEPRARTPTEGLMPPDSPTWNGWTTHEDREGQRVRIAFNKDGQGAYVAQFRNGPYRLEPMAGPGMFSGYSHPGGITPVFFTTGDPGFYGMGSVGVMGLDASGSLMLNNACCSSSPTGVAGAIWADRGTQPVYMFPTSDRSVFLAGGDEASSSLYRCTIGDPAARIPIMNVLGIPTHAAPRYNGAGICLNWITLLGAVRLGDAGGDYAVTDFLALVRPNSTGSWINEASPQTIMYSPDGTHWGEMFAPNYTAGDRSMQSAFFRQSVGPVATDRVVMGRGDGLGTWAIDKPTPATTVTGRPLQISRGGPNAVRQYTEGAVASVERMIAPSGQNVCVPVSRAAFGSPGAYADVPAPPCEGPIMRCQFIDSMRMGTWKIGADVSLPYRPRVKGRLWVYRMPAADSQNPNEFPINGAAKVSFFGSAIKASETVTETKLYQGPLIGGHGGSLTPGPGQPQGTGWTPFTFDLDPVGSDGPGTYFFAAKMVATHNEFNRQDVLIAVDYVGYADQSGRVELPARPLKYAAGTPAKDEKLELRFLPLHPLSEQAGSLTPWTMFTAFTLPTAGPDPKTSNRAESPDASTLFTLWAGARNYLRVVLDREYSTIWIMDGAGNAWPLEAPKPGADGVPFGQPWFAGRGRQVLLGIACDDAGGGAPVYRAWVSLGGSRVSYSTTTTLQGVTPNRIRTGDQNQQNPDAADYFGFYVEEGKASTEAEGRAMMADLRFLK